MTLLRALCAVCAVVTFASHASAQPHGGRVYLRESNGTQPEQARRLVAELERDGYVVTRQTHETVSPCTTPEAAPVPRGGEGTVVWLELDSEPERGEHVVTLCYSEPGQEPQRSWVRAPASDPRRLALATVEALNGLRAEAVSVAASAPEAARSAPDAYANDARSDDTRPRGATHFTSLAVDAVLVLNAGGGTPLIGPATRLESALFSPFALHVEVFASLHELGISAPDRELSLGAAWARAGVGAPLLQHPVRFALSLQAGVAATWASAEPDAPLLGTTKHATSAILSFAAGLEAPATSVLFVHAAARGSRLFPSVELVRGDGTTSAFGELLLETQLGLGARWH